MKAKDLRDRSTEDLSELCAMLRKDLFNYRMRNHTNQLDDTSLMQKARRDVARIELILHERDVVGVDDNAADGGNQS